MNIVHIWDADDDCTYQIECRVLAVANIKEWVILRGIREIRNHEISYLKRELEEYYIPISAIKCVEVYDEAKDNNNIIKLV